MYYMFQQELHLNLMMNQKMIHYNQDKYFLIIFQLIHFY